MHFPTIPICLLLLLLPCLANAAPKVVDSGKKCPPVGSSSYAAFSFTKVIGTNELETNLMAVSVVEQSGRVSAVFSVNQAFRFVTAPLPQYLKGFVQPIKASKKAALALTALVNGTASNYMGGVSTTFMVDCKYKSNSTLPNINLTLGVNKNTANLVLKSSDYVMKHATQGFCYLAFSYFNSDDFWSSGDYPGRQFCAQVDTAAQTVGFARPLA